MARYVEFCQCCALDPINARCSKDMSQSPRLQNVRAGDCHDQYSTTTSFEREGKLDPLQIGKIYSFIDSLMKENSDADHSEDMMVKYGFNYAHDCVGNLSEDAQILLYVLCT